MDASHLSETAGMGLNAHGLPDIAWCDIPAGEFLYGDAKTTLYLPAFRIGKYPVTYQQFQAFIDDPNCYANAQWWDGLDAAAHRQRKRGPAAQQFPFANHPRENVSWYEATAFCAWLSHQLGCSVTLPTEQQWEKAARGTNGLIYPFGDVFDPEKCNVCPNTPDRTTPVDHFPDGASPYGVMDMSGNVWEWTLTECDRGESADNAPRGSAWRNVMRGGSWRNRPNRARAAARLPYGIKNRYINLGFRLVSSKIS